MAKQGVTFTPPAARRIGDTVRHSEGVRKSGKATQRRWPKPTGEAGGGIAAVVVRTRDFGSDSQILTVTLVVDGEDGPQFGATREMWTWFGLPARVYAALAQLTGETPHPTKILPAFRIDGKWRVRQVVFWNFALQEERFKVEACLPVVVP